MIKGKYLLTPLLALLATPLAAQSFRDRLPEQEVVYFLLPDRFENGDAKNDKGGLKGDRLKTGYDPAAKGFYHGGDLKGLIKRLDYLQGLGATAVWLSPIFKNKVVQGPKGDESAAYHGYWVTDFTTVDPHIGTEADFRALVDAAHARGMKVYMDIITNHTADVIDYREGVANNYVYRSKADYPYSRRASDGAAINKGFKGEHIGSAENFAKLTDQNFAYTPYVAKGDENIKKPDWLNDISLYHNRGNSTFMGESSTMGDFVGLDDIMTEHPRVVQGFINLYGSWIDRYGIDGFRIDTAKHVNPEFWQAFAPAMLARAKAKGIPNFHIFGEVATGDFDPVLTASSTHIAKLPSNLDFAFRAATLSMLAGNGGTDMLDRLLMADPLYAGGEATANRLPTFTGNHDFGRFGHFVQTAFPKASDDELLKRAILSNVLMFTTRGVPVVYSGDEQGFTGDGGDQLAREDMFPSKVDLYNDNKLIGTTATTATSNFDTSHPLYKAIAELSKLRTKKPQLISGKTVVRSSGQKPGILAYSRVSPGAGEMLIAMNTSTSAITTRILVETDSQNWVAAGASCAVKPVAPGSIEVSLPPLGYAICEASKPK